MEILKQWLERVGNKVVHCARPLTIREFYFMPFAVTDYIEAKKQEKETLNYIKKWRRLKNKGLL